MALNLQNAKEKFISALFGAPAQAEGITPTMGYGEDIDKAVNELGNQAYMQELLKQPKQESLTLDQYKQDFVQGLNHGIPQIAEAQQQLGIRIPKTEEEKELARTGQFNQPSLINVGTATTPRQGGFFNDLAQGYKENTSQGFDVQNWLPQEKSFGTRLGEGLGSIARFADSPLGRGLIAYGLSKSVGDDNPLKQGIIAGVGRQGNITRDKAYRQNLAQMGYTPEEINAIPGNVSDDIYSNLIRAKQLQDNAEYRNMMLQNQQAQNELMNQYRQEQLNYQRMQDIQDRAMKEREFNYRASQDAFDNYIASENLKAKQNKVDTKEEAKRKQSQSTLNMIDTALNTVKDNNNAFGFWKGAAPNEITSRTDTQGVGARAVVDSVTAEYRKYLTGAQMSDKERKDYEKFLPSPRDNAEIITRKLNAMKDVISAREGIYNAAPGLNIDMDAINAELKRRGQ